LWKVLKATYNYLGLLPYRTPKGTLLFPTGQWSGGYFSEPLKFAAENGYEINIIKGYNFNKVYDAFKKKFVTEIYKIKSKGFLKTTQIKTSFLLPEIKIKS